MLCMFLPSGPDFLHSYLFHTYKVEVCLWAGSLCWVFSRGTITANIGLQAQFCTDNQWCPSRFQSYQTQGNCWWCLAMCAQWRVCSWYALYSSTPVCKMSSLNVIVSRVIWRTHLSLCLLHLLRVVPNFLHFAQQPMNMGPILLQWSELVSLEHFLLWKCINIKNDARLMVVFLPWKCSNIKNEARKGPHKH
jgi:hypothetical protein